jgi:DNA mismatch endonuclease (patch repair protein)
MADVHSKEVRSYNMSQIKGKDTKPEMAVRKFLFANGFRYTLHNTKLPGKPDIVLKKYNTVIFVNGCFWHGHKGCKYFVYPRSKAEWWTDKITTTQIRDKNNRKLLQKDGYKVITIWECEINR